MENCKNCAVLQQCSKATHIENYKIPECSEFKRLFGEWKINPDGYYPYCFSCGEEPKNGVMSNYCPNCGLEMKKGKINI